MPKNQRKLYLLDANIIIHAHDLYYPMGRVPEFWQWLEFHAKNGSIAMPKETHGELKGGENAEHVQWANCPNTKGILILNEEFDHGNLARVVAEGYAPDLNEVELESLGMDPFLIAYALADPEQRIVVSNEVSKPSKIRHNRHIPDVCTTMGVRCCNIYRMLRDLDFRTNWDQAV